MIHMTAGCSSWNYRNTATGFHKTLRHKQMIRFWQGIGYSFDSAKQREKLWSERCFSAVEIRGQKYCILKFRYFFFASPGVRYPSSLILLFSLHVAAAAAAPRDRQFVRAFEMVS